MVDNTIYHGERLSQQVLTTLQGWPRNHSGISRPQYISNNGIYSLQTSPDTFLGWICEGWIISRSTIFWEICFNYGFYRIFPKIKFSSSISVALTAGWPRSANICAISRREMHSSTNDTFNCFSIIEVVYLTCFQLWKY